MRPVWTKKVRNILRMMVRLHMIELTEVPDSDGKKENSGSEEQEPESGKL